MRRRQSVLFLALTAILVAVGAWVVQPPTTEGRAVTPAGPASALTPPDPATQSAALEAARASGVRLLIDAIDVDAPVATLDPAPGAARLPAPQAPEVVGMLSGIVEGEHALLVGHVNWHTGEPAVFERLAELEPGDTIRLEQGGVVREYRVRHVEDVDAHAAVEDVMPSGVEETITLMTCSGDYLPDAGMYATRRVVVAVRVDR